MKVILDKSLFGKLIQLIDALDMSELTKNVNRSSLVSTTLGSFLRLGRAVFPGDAFTFCNDSSTA